MLKNEEKGMISFVAKWQFTKFK